MGFIQCNALVKHKAFFSVALIFHFSEMTQPWDSSAETQTKPIRCVTTIEFASAATPLSAAEVWEMLSCSCKVHSTFAPQFPTSPWPLLLLLVAVCWTKWYDRDNPSGTGDWELLSDLMAENPGELWYYPMYIEAVTTDTMTPAVSTGETFHM